MYNLKKIIERLDVLASLYGANSDTVKSVRVMLETWQKELMNQNQLYSDLIECNSQNPNFQEKLKGAQIEIKVVLGEEE